MLFNSIQNGHIVPLVGQTMLPSRTGYESILGVRAPDKFVTSAVEEGKVIKIDNKSITVEYKTQGTKTYFLKEWTSKEEAGKTYIHKMVTNLKLKETFHKDDTIIYDDAFFGPDMFDRKRVAYKTGMVINTVLLDSQETYEDSGGISVRASEFLSTKVTKVRDFVLKASTAVTDVIKIGDSVEYNDVLFKMLEQTDDSDVNKYLELSENSRAILDELKNASPKAKVAGVVKNIKVFYNAEKDEITESMGKLIKMSDKLLKESGEKYTGKVDGTYGVKGKSLVKGEVHIKIYIESKINMGNADKAIVGNQLKFTVGEIFDNRTQSENGTPVDLMFSAISIDNRIVNSTNAIGTTNAIMIHLTKTIVEEYFD